jgi:hypothetical protein
MPWIIVVARGLINDDLRVQNAESSTQVAGAAKFHQEGVTYSSQLSPQCMAFEALLDKSLNRD